MEPTGKGLDGVLKDIFTPKEVKKFRASEEYQRLKQDFKDKGVNSDQNFHEITLGQIFDALVLYKKVVEAGSDFQCFTRITNSIPEASNFTEELNKFVGREENFDRQSEFYNLKPDISKFMKSELGGYIDLSHYPGGLSIKNDEDRGGFKFQFTNRQRSDDGKPVNKVFRETGLPFDSGIRE